MMFDQVTVVVGIDAKTIEYLKVSCETWRLNRPEMWKMPWVLFHDWTTPGGITDKQLWQMTDQLSVPNLIVTPWPMGGASRSDYESQRDMMLSGHVWVPAACVNTDWSMKIDADSIAMAPSNWLQEEWFADLCRPEDGECDADCEPRYISPAWHYTKGQNFLGRLEEWGDNVKWGPYGDHSRLNIPFDPTHLRVPHKRMCSWVSYYNVSWLGWLCRELDRTVGAGRLPVPSQDTTVWYAEARENKENPLHRLVNMKKLAWTNCPKLSSLKETAARVLNTDPAASIVDA